MKALLKVGYRCTSDCLFCHSREARGVDAPQDGIDALVRRAVALGHDLVAFSGGEASLQAGLRRWGALTASLGLDLGLVTNATSLDAPTVDWLLGRRLRYVHLSLHGGSAAIHDALAGASTFECVRRAMALLSGRGLEVWVNCVVTTPNLHHLRGVVDALRPFPDLRLKFSMVEPRGGASGDGDELVPRVTDAAAAVADAVAYAEALGLRGVAHDGLPLCLLPGLEDRRSDLRAHGFASMAEVGERDLHPVDALNAVHPPACRTCERRGRCPGLYLGYHARHGAAELRPVTGRPQSNAFHWTLEGMVVGGRPGRCPVLELGVTPWDRGRHLFVRNGERMARYRADTADFTDAEVADVKLRLGQVYLDRSRKEAPDDFARQLVQLRRSPTCDPCVERDHCTGLFEPLQENVFARDDAHVRRLLAGLEGDVLDVGCGEGPYAEELAGAARSGRLRYTGLEPEAGRAAALSARWPWARVVVGYAEEVAIEPDSLDHVLFLRSWNHLRDPAAALDRLVAALRPGGTLLAVDNVAFGLVRTRAQAERGERSAAVFEHHRNDGAEEAARWMEGRGLRLEERRDVGPETSNQWLLRWRLARRPGPGPACSAGAPGDAGR
jgi:MoaA/NifB/PqqE/SkfB family radical SAM enzyme/SAM-dependent methyltransferase